jgi:hypothetical protein
MDYVNLDSNARRFLAYANLRAIELLLSATGDELRARGLPGAAEISHALEALARQRRAVVDATHP